MSLVELYYYLFYKLRKFSQKTPSMLSSDFNAILLLNGLEIALVASICFFIEIYNKKHTNDNVFLVELILPSIFILIFNAVIFSERNVQLVYCIKSFDSWPKKKNVIGSISVITVVVVIVVLCLVSGNISGEYNILNSTATASVLACGHATG